MKTTGNRLRSLLMCAVLVLTMLPTEVFAAGGDPMSTPLQEAWTKIAQFSSADVFHSVPWCTDIAVNDEIPNDNPDIYVTTNLFNYAVMKGSYSNGAYTFNELGGNGKPTFDQYNQPVSLAIDGSYYDKDIYVSTNNMTTVGKVWKFDGTNWTDITYGMGMNAPALSAQAGGNLFAADSSARKLFILWSGDTAWQTIDLTPYIANNLVAVSVPNLNYPGENGYFVLDETGKIWKITFSTYYPTTTLESCTLVATAPSGGGSGLVVRSIPYTGFDFIVADSSHGCVEVLPCETQSWVVMKNGSPNSFAAPIDIAVDWQGYMYVTDRNLDNGTVFKQHNVPRLIWNTQPGNGLSGGTLSPQPVLKLVYSDGYSSSNVAVGNSVDQVTLTLASGSGTLLGTQTVTLNQGSATFSNLGITGPGNYTLTATCAGLTTVSNSFTVTEKTLVSITASPAITDVANGTEKTASALGLPSAVTLVTDNGSVSANVSWDVASSSYDTGSAGAQTFTVSGTVTLPNGVINPNSIPLTTSISVSVRAAPTYGIILDKTGIQTFTAQTAGYSPVTPLSVAVSNTGNQATGDLTVALSGTYAGSFALSKTTIGSIAAGAIDNFTVVPNGSLPVGTYTATVTVSGNNVSSQTFTVSFTVNSSGQAQYVALGDSIAAGYGLSDLSKSYVAIVGATLGLPTESLASNGLSSPQLLALLNASPDVATALSNVKVITLSIGSNDVLGPFMQIVADKLGCSIDQINATMISMQQTNPMGLFNVLAALNADDGTGLKNNATLQAAASGFAANFQAIVSEMKHLAPNAAIYVTNAYNPYQAFILPYGSGILDLGTIADGYIQTLNSAFSASSSDYMLIDAYSAFSASLLSGTSLVNANLLGLNFDPHPNAAGHAAIASLIMTASAAYPMWPSNSALAASDITSTGATMTWPAAVGGITATGYKLYQNGTLIALMDKTTLSYIATGLSASTSYTFQVQAVGVNGACTTDGPTVTVTTSPASSGDDTGGGSNSGSGTSYQGVVSTDDGISTITNVKVDTNQHRVIAEISSTQGTSITNGKHLTVTVPSLPNVTGYAVTLPVSALAADAGGALTLSGDVGSITFPSNMLTGLSGGTRAEVTMSQQDPSSLPDELRAEIGHGPIIQLSMSVDGKVIEWNNPNAPVTVSIPYTPTAAELQNPSAIVIWYIDGSGNLICVPNGHYDAAAGTVIFQTTHFSNYAVGYNKVSFRDVTEGAWYYEAVSFAASRSITLGTGSGVFSPDAALMRGQFIVLLMRAYSISADTNPTDNFADAGNTYYTNYLATAKRLGISNGVGDNLFAPDRAITRQEMFTLLYNALKVFNQLPQDDSGKALSDFSDKDSISSYAQEAMAYLVQAGAVNGNNGLLLPTATMTRAQFAQVFFNLLGE